MCAGEAEFFAKEKSQQRVVGHIALNHLAVDF
jgi:hypothetical protein